MENHNSHSDLLRERGDGYLIRPLDKAFLPACLASMALWDRQCFPKTLYFPEIMQQSDIGRGGLERRIRIYRAVLKKYPVWSDIQNQMPETDERLRMKLLWHEAHEVLTVYEHLIWVRTETEHRLRQGVSLKDNAAFSDLAEIIEDIQQFCSKSGGSEPFVPKKH